MISLFPSCSNLVETTRESLLGDKKKRQSPKKDVKWVSKAQYDDLMVKYKDLSQRYENLKENKTVSSTSQMADETIDVFAEANKQMKKQQPTRPKAPAVKIDVEKVDQEIEYYKKAKILYANGKVDEALKIFQRLEKAASRQIQVRSKEKIADIFFSKAQYDLALQLYEAIIRQYAFSGRVLPALKKAVQCSEKLGLMDKKERYYSLLTEGFKEQV